MENSSISARYLYDISIRDVVDLLVELAVLDMICLQGSDGRDKTHTTKRKA